MKHKIEQIKALKATKKEMELAVENGYFQAYEEMREKNKLVDKIINILKLKEL